MIAREVCPEARAQTSYLEVDTEGDGCMVSAGRLGERESTCRHLGGPHMVIPLCGSISHVHDVVQNVHLFTLLVHPSILRFQQCGRGLAHVLCSMNKYALAIVMGFGRRRSREREE